MVHQTLGNKFQWNLNLKASFFIKKMDSKMFPAKWRPSSLGLNVLKLLSYDNLASHLKGTRTLETVYMFLDRNDRHRIYIYIYMLKHCCSVIWWRHQMETFSALLAICAWNSPVTGEFPTQRPVTRRFDVFFDLRLNKRLSKQWWSWWFETPSRPLWRHCNGHTHIHIYIYIYICVSEPSYLSFR